MMCSVAGVDGLVQHLPQLTDMPVTTALNHPAFWELAQAAAEQRQVLNQDLQLLGYDIAAAASTSSSQLQQMQKLLGIEAAILQQQLVQQSQADTDLLLPGHAKQLHGAMVNSSQGHQSLAQLQLLQLLAQALGFSGVQVTGPASAPELVRRLTGTASGQQAVDAELLQQISAAGPQLLSAVTQVPVKALAQPSVDKLLQLMNSRPELQVGHALRAARHDCGSIDMLSTCLQPAEGMLLFPHLLAYQGCRLWCGCAACSNLMLQYDTNCACCTGYDCCCRHFTSP